MADRTMTVESVLRGDVRLADILAALSHALDLTEGQPVGHSLRCCWIGYAIGQAYGLSERELCDLYYTLLLKDLGCSSNAARICSLYLADDRSFKRDFKLVGDSLPQALRFVLDHTGLKAGLAERFGAVLQIVRNGGEIARELIETRCTRGADIARRMRFSESVARGIQDLDEHWDGGGKPEGRKGGAISLSARIALVAQVVDVFHTTSGPEAARRELRQRAGTWFDPVLVRQFEEVATEPAFWAGLAPDGLEARILGLPPGQRRDVLDDGYLDDIGSAFAEVVDAKSPYTAGHSDRVALFADMISGELGLPAPRRAWLRRTALLHDIGKLGVSNQILDKPGKLDDAEWHVMRGHAGASERILSRIGPFADLSRIAGAHHERLDGKGYPNGLAGHAIGLETRIISVADVFDALTAERPYRAAMPTERAFAILSGDVGSALDGDCVEALRRAVAAAR